jgi:hypothetical protein
MAGSVSMKYGAYTFDPIPLVSIARERIRDSSSNKLFDRVSLGFSGWLIANKAGQDFGGIDFDKFVPFVSGLRHDRAELIITHESGVFVSGVFPRLEGLAIDEDSWVNKLKYSFELVYDEIDSAVGVSGLVNSISDEWSWNEDDNDTVSVSHTVSADGINSAAEGSPSNALTNAKNLVDVRLGLNEIPATFPQRVFNLYNSTSYIKRSQSESVNKQGGSYSVTEDFLFASGISNTCVHRNSFDFSKDQGGVVTVNVNGNIIPGGEIAYDRAANALNCWNTDVSPLIYSQASGVYIELGGSYTLGQNPISQSVSRNKNSGAIDYSRSYTDRLQDAPADIIDENFNKSIQYPVEVNVIIPIPGKQDGGVRQKIGTTSEGSYSLSIDVTGNSLAAAKSRAQTLVNLYGGQSVGTDRWITSNSIAEDPRNNKVSGTITWGFFDDGATHIIQ